MLNCLLECVYELIVHLSGELAALLSPVKKRVVLTSFGGSSFGGDTALIALQLLKRDHNYDIVWLLTDTAIAVPPGIKKFAYYDYQKKLLPQIFKLFRAQCLLSSAQVTVFDTKTIVYYKKHHHSTYIQTGHGAMPFKLIEGECESEIGRQYIRHSKEDSKKIDIFLSSCPAASKMFKTSFWLRQDCRILEIGIPRHDYYFSNHSAASDEFRKQLNIPKEVKIAVYAPTFRDDGTTSVYSSLDFDRVTTALTAKTGDRWIVITRLHPNVIRNQNRDRVSHFTSCIDASNYSNGQTIFGAADLLITDVSTVIYDFLVMKKPILLFFPDHDRYVSICRPIRQVYYSLPIKICRSTDEVVSLIGSEFLDKVVENCQKIDDRIGLQPFDNGHATERVVDLIEKLLSRSK